MTQLDRAWQEMLGTPEPPRRVEPWPVLPEHCVEPALRLTRRLEQERGSQAFTVDWERTLAGRAEVVVTAALAAPQQYGLDHLVAQRFYEDPVQRQLLVASVITRASMFWPLSLLIYGRPRAEDLRRAAGVWEWQNVEGSTVLEGGEPEEFRGRTSREIDARVLQWLKDRVLSVVTSGARGLTETTPQVNPTYPTAGRGPARFAVIIPPALTGDAGVGLTVRLRVQGGPETLADLISSAMTDEGCAEFLRWCVLGRLNIFIGGDTGTGKTTLQSCLCREIPESEWLWTIEDSAELELGSRVLRDGRPAHARTFETSVVVAGTIGQRDPAPYDDLVRHALRHRPNRIMVGEARGGEAFEVLKAMTAGHPGALTGLHALSVSEVRDRLLVMLLEAKNRPDPELANRLIDMALQVCVFVANRGGRHVVDQVCVYSEKGVATMVYERSGMGAGELRRSVMHINGLPERIRERLRPYGIEVPGR